jgi:hypothetical protein
MAQFDFENEAVHLAEKASSWNGDWCDFAEVAEKALRAANAASQPAGYVLVRCHTGFSPLRQAERMEVAHVSWTKEGDTLPPEAKKAEIDRILAAVEAERHDMVAINRKQLIEIYDALAQITRLGQATAKEWLEMPRELAALKHQIFRLAEMPAVFAGQHLSADDRAMLRSKWQKAAE